MINILSILILLFSLATPASALEIEVPAVPESGKMLMPENTDSFSDGLAELLQNAAAQIRPDLADAASVSLSVSGAVMILSLFQFSGENLKKVTAIAGSVAIATILLQNADSMIHLGADTIQELSDYGKLLFPVMTAAMAAQGAVTSSAALYTGTAVFDAFLSSFISGLLVPLVYLYLALSTVNSAIGEDFLKRIRDLIKNSVSWCLKTILTVFTTYISITGVVSGTTDAAALKAAKVTISSVVPVVGGILSDASEAVLVSAGIMKNAAGIYGILALIAVFLEPFLRIGTHYLLLKVTASLCDIIGSKELTGLIDDFSSAMGLLLAMTGAVCLMLLISTICFMKEVS